MQATQKNKKAVIQAAAAPAALPQITAEPELEELRKLADSLPIMKEVNSRIEIFNLMRNMDENIYQEFIRRLRLEGLAKDRRQLYFRECRDKTALPSLSGHESSAGLERKMQKISEQLNCIQQQTAGVPSMVEERQDETIKRFSQFETIKKLAELTRDEEIVFNGWIQGKTQSQIAAKNKWTVDHVKYISRNVKPKVEKYGISLIWHGAPKRDRSRPIEAYGDSKK